jgi:hypothetical protein
LRAESRALPGRVKARSDTVLVSSIRLSNAGRVPGASLSTCFPVGNLASCTSGIHPDGMLVHKAYKFRIYPDATQEELFLRTIGCCRLVYNLCLDQKKLERERSNPRRLTAFDQMKEPTSLKREFLFLKEPPSQTLQQAIHDLHKAFKNFFEGRAGFPTFRKKGRNDAFRYPDATQSIEEDRISLPKAGWTEMFMHRPIVGTVKPD